MNTYRPQPDSVFTVRELISIHRSNPRHTNSSFLAATRMAKGMTQAQLAEAVGVTQQQISRWEAGTVEPRASALKKIGEALGVEWQTLI